MAREKKLNVDIRVLGALVTDESIEVVTEYSGPDAREAVSDDAQAEMARGADVEIIDMSTGHTSGSQQFSGFGDGKWGEIREHSHNGRTKIVHTRPAGPSTDPIIQ